MKSQAEKPKDIAVEAEMARSSDSCGLFDLCRMGLSGRRVWC